MRRVEIDEVTATFCLRMLEVDARPPLESATKAPARSDFQRGCVEKSVKALRGLDSLIEDLRKAIR